MPFLPWPILVLVAVIVLVIVLVALDRLACWMERKGWIYWREKKSRASSPVRGVLSTFQEIVQPEIRYVKEDRDQRSSQSGQDNPSGR